MGIRMKSAVLIPSYCPNEKIMVLTKQLLNKGFACIQIVDDGSGSEYRTIFQELERMGCSVITHEENKGKGAALKTGIAELTKRYKDLECIVTADSDGQHSVQDICNLVDHEEENENALTLGVRSFTGKEVPIKSSLGNRFSAFYFKMSTGVECSDTQTGLRVIPKSLFPLAMSTPGDRYEYEMNFLTSVAKKKISMVEIPICTIYEENNEGSHFHPIKDSFLIYKTPIRYLCTSLLCSLVDLGIFSILSHIVLAKTLLLVFVATVTARICSGILNFALNRVWSFQSNSKVGTQAIKYFLLFISQMLASWLLVSALAILPLPLFVIKIPVDCILFVFSYFIQLNWVFAQEKMMQQEVITSRKLG